MNMEGDGLEFPDSTTPLKALGLRACGTCVKAKVKCVPNLERGRCQRCQRLDKICQPSTSSSRKRPQSTQVAQLEKKLDSLVNLLQSKESNTQTPNFSANSSRSPITVNQGNTPREPEDEPSLGPGQDSQPVFVACRRDKETSESWGSEKDPFDFGLERQESAFLLLEFRTQQAPQFPFVVIPPDATSESLRQEKPMLWKAVMTASSYHKPLRQEAMGWKLMEEFSLRLLMKAEKSLELLQALLVHLAWYHYHSAANPQATNLLFLAKSLLVNLGYHKSRTLKSRPNLNLDGPDGLSRDVPNTKTPTLSRSLEEWRALAGVFFLSAMTASSCRRMDPLLYTPHLEAVCKTLGDMQEYNTDCLIMPLVSIQNVVLKMSSSLQELDVSSPMSVVPIRMYMAVLQKELDAIKRTIPTNQRADGMWDTAISCLQVAEISLYEIGLYRPFWQESDKSQRLTTLYACLVAVKSYFDDHFAPGIRVPASFPYFMWILNGYALLLGAKLCFSNAEGWDFDHARTLLDYVNVIDKVTEKLEAIVRLRAPHGKYEIFTRYIKQIRCKQIRGMGNGHRQDAASLPPVSMDRHMADPSQPTNSFVPDGSHPLYDDQIFMDDSFWQGLLDSDNDWMMLGQ